MEIATEHFIAKKIKTEEASFLWNIFIKNVDGSVELFTVVDRSILLFPGTKLQDYITSWELFKEFVQLLDSLQ